MVRYPMPDAFTFSTNSFGKVFAFELACVKSYGNSEPRNFYLVKLLKLTNGILALMSSSTS